MFYELGIRPSRMIDEIEMNEVVARAVCNPRGFVQHVCGWVISSPHPARVKNAAIALIFEALKAGGRGL